LPYGWLPAGWCIAATFDGHRPCARKVIDIDSQHGAQTFDRSRALPREC
jgi:hypothetical protein